MATKDFAMAFALICFAIWIGRSRRTSRWVGTFCAALFAWGMLTFGSAMAGCFAAELMKELGTRGYRLFLATGNITLATTSLLAVAAAGLSLRDTIAKENRADHDRL